MIRSLFSYSKFIYKSAFSAEERKLLRNEWSRANHNASSFKETRSQKIDDSKIAVALSMAVEWLLRAQLNTDDSGFGSYRIGRGWTSSYPETTGYIIPTLMNYAIRKNDNEIIKSCVGAADWLLEIQKSSGGWQGETLLEQRPEVVFNTGQIIRGLIVMYKHTQDEKYLNSSIKAADWLCDIQEADGSWVKNAYMNVARVYDSYVDVPLLQLFQITGNERYKETAVKNLDWIVDKKQLANGWFSDCDNTIKHNDKPILHTISYTIDGLINSGLILDDQKYIQAGQKAAKKLLDIYNKDRFFNGRYDKNWTGSQLPILTGYAQMAINWMSLYHITQNNEYLKGSLGLTRQLIWLQRTDNCPLDGARGAISGSFPVWGKYEPFSYPNWATKYFVDALLLHLDEMKVKF